MTDNLRSLAWVRDEQSARIGESTETCYALNALYIYRRVTDLTAAVARPRYFRAQHRDVLRKDGRWSELDESIWKPVDETGRPMNDGT